MSLWRWIRRLFCRHAVYYDTDMHRISSDEVQGVCYKCGKVLTADCGIHLNAELHRRRR